MVVLLLYIMIVMPLNEISEWTPFSIHIWVGEKPSLGLVFFTGVSNLWRFHWHGSKMYVKTPHGSTLQFLPIESTLEFLVGLVWRVSWRLFWCRDGIEYDWFKKDLMVGVAAEILAEFWLALRRLGNLKNNGKWWNGEKIVIFERSIGWDHYHEKL